MCGRQDRMAAARPPHPCIAGALAVSVCVALVSCSSQETQESQPTSSSPAITTSSVPAFETQDAFAWLTAACGSPSVMDARPNSWLPEAQDVRLCLTAIDRPGVLVGVYDDPAASASDLKKIEGLRGYASRRDAEGRTWVFVVEGRDPAPLKPLERYGFVIP